MIETLTTWAIATAPRMESSAQSKLKAAFMTASQHKRKEPGAPLAAILLAERAASEDSRWTRAVGGQPDRPCRQMNTRELEQESDRTWLGANSVRPHSKASAEKPPSELRSCSHILTSPYWPPTTSPIFLMSEIAESISVSQLL